jgi:hypothetical protein
MPGHGTAQAREGRTVNPNHRDKAEARTRRQQEGRPYAAALADIRRERLERRDCVTAEETAPDPRALRQPLPPELPLLVRHHVEQVGKLFQEALEHAYWARNYGDWSRIVLYRLTDALEHLHLAVGTVVVHLQHNRVPAEDIVRFLQVRHQKDVDLFVTQDAKSHLRGLLRQDSDYKRKNDIDEIIGASIVDRRGFVHPATEDQLEAFLAAIYSNPFDPDVFDGLPPHIRDCAREAAKLQPASVDDNGTRTISVRTRTADEPPRDES